LTLGGFEVPGQADETERRLAAVDVEFEIVLALAKGTTAEEITEAVTTLKTGVVEAGIVVDDAEIITEEIVDPEAIVDEEEEVDESISGSSPPAVLLSATALLGVVGACAVALV
jgi:hypothetical protein